MSRVEENRKYIKYLDSETKKQGDMLFQSSIVWTLCEMRGLLADISKSLAVIADKAESEGQE
jgi:hypothetical protein